MWIESVEGEVFNLDRMSAIRVQADTASDGYFVAAYEGGTEGADSATIHRLTGDLDEVAARDLCRRIARALRAEKTDTIGKPREVRVI